jgi:hypothetical protein
MADRMDCDGVWVVWTTGVSKGCQGIVLILLNIGEYDLGFPSPIHGQALL